jgi:hypothetical protein
MVSTVIYEKDNARPFLNMIIIIQSSSYLRTMKNLNFIIENYKGLSTPELLQIASDPSSLEVEVIPHLQAELLNRGKQEEALQLSTYLIQKPKEYKTLSRDELAKIVQDRLDSGEPLESISLDLKDQGINVFDILQNESTLKDKQFDYLVSLKDDGLDESAINEKMKGTFNLTEEEADIINRQLKNKGRYNLIIGYSLVIISVIIILAALGSGGSIGFGAVLLVAIGLWRILEGHRQRK